MSDAGEEIGTSSSSITTEDTSSNSKTTEDTSPGSKTIEDTSSSSKTTEDLQEPDNLCNICYEPIKQPVKIRGCLHEFDWECIEKWIYGIGNRLCPMCRGDICVQNPYTPDCPQTRPPYGFSWRNMEPGSEERRQEYIRFMMANTVHQHNFSEALRHRPGARESYLRWVEDLSYLHLYDEPPTEEEMSPAILFLGSLEDSLPETDYGEDSDSARSGDAREAIEDGSGDGVEQIGEDEAEGGTEEASGEASVEVGEHGIESVDQDYEEDDVADYNDGHDEDPDNEDGDLLTMLMLGL